MATIILRQANVFNSPNATVKGSPLTNSEVDNNFANINVELSDLGNTVAALSTFEISNANTRLSITTADGPLDLTGNIIPTASNVFSLGSPGNIFADLFLSGNSLHLGSLTLSVINGNIALDGNEVLSPSGGATPADGTITEAKIASGAVTTAKLANVTGTGNVVLQTSPVLLTPNIGTATAQGVTLSDGAVGTPAINFGSDTDTGIYRIGDNNIGFVTGGALRANINSTGFFEAAFKDKVVALGNSGTSQTINLALGSVFTTTLTGSCTFTISNAQVGSSFVLQITNDGTAGRSVAFTPGTFRYPFGSIGRSTGANAIDVWYFTTFDGGTNWIAALPIKSAATA